MTLSSLTAPAWTSQALCALPQNEQLFEDTLIPASQSVKSYQVGAIAEAKRICISCPVRAKCLQSAMESEAYLGGTERHGVRGGLTARERILIAAEDPLCARCREKPVAKWQRVYHIRRMCRGCQLETLDMPAEKYLPEKR